IQAAIDAAAPGDVVLVSPGTYHERIEFGGKAIEVRSATDTPSNTILDGDGAGPVVTFDGGEGRASVLRGFQIREGLGSFGGGIRIVNSSPTVRNNHVTGNQAVNGGAGLGIQDGSPLIVDNNIQDNGPSAATTDGAGGRIAVDGGSAEIVANWLFDNEWLAGGGVALSWTGTQLRDNRIYFNRATATYGGGVLLMGDTDASLVQNHIRGNSAALAGGGIGSVALGTKQPVIVNNTVAANTGPKGTGVYAGPQETLVLTNNVIAGPFGSTVLECESASFATLSHNNLSNGGPSPASGCGAVVGVNGNIGIDPQFYSDGNDRPTGRSGAIDGGDPAAAAGLVPAVDFDGRPRVVDGDGNGTATVDMGAFEAGPPNLGPPEGWGWNIVGAVGDGTTTDRHAPVPVTGLANVVSVAGGVYHSIALKRDGTVWTWGWNGAGQLGDGTTVDRQSPVQVPGLTDVVEVALGGYHSLALKRDGTVWAWGWNPVGQLGDGTTTDRHLPVQVPGLTGITAIAAGAFHTLAVKSDGTLWSWGWNGVGQLGDGTTVDRHAPVAAAGLTDVTGIAAGYYHNIAIQNGSIYVWGWNVVGQLGTGSTVDSHVPVRNVRISGMVRVAAGAYHTLALEGDGTVHAWGWNGVGQVGDGTTVDRYVPVFLGISHVAEIAAGAFHSVLLKDDGTVQAWGWNGAGQLGDGSTVDRHVPTVIPGAAGSQAIGAGAYHSLAS
ncbi:MAG: right-handed parallel beta-helix repeat-containing protein, partial [Actinomycetota bacterium]|nr:right-handed parallel beta-helix repeat-containing protein [Actinomycetota bacterium]